jgi:hypothetical protein
MDAFLEISFYILITVGYLISATGGIFGCVCFTGFLILLMIIYVAPQLGSILCGILFLAWR